MKPTKLTAENLKQELWATLQGVKSGKNTPEEGVAVCMAAKAITGVVRTELVIAQLRGGSSGTTLGYSKSQKNETRAIQAN